MQVKEMKSEGKITLEVEGRVDTNTSASLQQAVLLAFQKTQTVILDLQEVSYISSAGLRVLLIGHKTAASKGGIFEVHNLQETVAMVLQMSGFDKILTIL